MISKFWKFLFQFTLIYIYIEFSNFFPKKCEILLTKEKTDVDGEWVGYRKMGSDALMHQRTKVENENNKMPTCA